MAREGQVFGHKCLRVQSFNKGAKTKKTSSDPTKDNLVGFLGTLQAFRELNFIWPFYMSKLCCKIMNVFIVFQQKFPSYVAKIYEHIQSISTKFP